MYPYFENMVRKLYIHHSEESYNYDSHFQNKIEICYCFSGKQKVRVEDEVYILSSGDAVFIMPNLVHEYIKCETAEDMSTEVIAFICDTDIISPIIPDLVTKRLVSPFIPAGLINKDTSRAFRRMTDNPDNIELLGWGCIAISGIVKNLEFVPLKSRGGDKLAPSIISYINANFTKNLTISTIAKEFGYSRSYITHVFYDRLKIPFRTYLGSVRSEYAKDMILKTDKTLTEIAFECGYNSVNTFCRCFKKRFGITPSGVRTGKKNRV